MITVYGLTDEHGQILYVGHTARDLSFRWEEHRTLKHPFSMCGMAVLDVARTRKSAARKETKWIMFLGLENLINKVARAGWSWTKQESARHYMEDKVGIRK